MTISLYEAIKTLVGPVSSVGESNADARRLRSLKDTIELVDRLLGDIRVAAQTRGYPEASRAKIGKTAQEYLDQLKSELES